MASFCRCEGGAEVQQNLLVRLQNLTQLQALLANTLAILPSPPNLQLVAGQQGPAHQQEKGQVVATLPLTVTRAACQPLFAKFVI